MLDARHQTVSLRQPGEKIFADGDSVRLCQVIANLLTNASKYSPERARIDVAIEGTTLEGAVSVRDPGVGIDAQLLPQLLSSEPPPERLMFATSPLPPFAAT